MPLAGDYEVECDIIQPGSQPSQILLGGIYLGPHPDMSFLEVEWFIAASNSGEIH